MRRKLHWWVGLAVMVFCFSVVVTPMLGADFRSPDKTGSLTLDKSVETKNLFVAGNELNIEANTIQKDLFAIGSTIQLNTRVEQGSFLAGRTVTIRGVYGGNLFVAGSEVTIEAEVMGDVFLVCNQWKIKQGAIIHGDVYVVAGTGYLDGSIKGSLTAAGNEFYLNGVIDQTAKVTIAKSLTIGEKASLHLLEYEAPQKATVLEGAVIQETKYEPTATDSSLPRKPFRFPVISYAASLLFALILVFWLRKPMTHLIETIQQQFFASLGIGFAVIVCLPIAVIFLLISLLGYKIAIALLLLYAFGLLCMNPIAGIWLGDLVLRLVKKPVASPSWLGALIGITLMQFIAWIPYVGWILLLFLNILAFGSGMITFFRYAKEINSL